MGYVVGLMATDGNLSGDGRHLSFDSGDIELVRTFLACLGRPNTHIRLKRGEFGGVGYQAQFSDVRFHRWLSGIGLMPRKSLVLGGIDVPDAHLLPLVRGLFEGDGHIQNFVHRPTPSRYPDYEYERLWVFFNSASRPHLEWIDERVQASLRLHGLIEKLKPRPRRHDFFRLKYGKHASIALLKAMYPSSDIPKLERKWQVWDDYFKRNGANSAVREGGVEPPRPYGHMALNHDRLPLRHSRLEDQL